MMLDVGCGEIGLGDVNCDIKRPDRIPLNFVRCDVQKLPFKNCCFSDVEAHHIIEHVINPFLFLDEIKRVLVIGGKLLLICPHRFSSGAKNEGHIHFFTRGWFAKYLIGSRPYPVFIFHLLVYNIEVSWRKTKND